MSTASVIATQAKWWEEYKVDLPEGQHGSITIERFTITEDQAKMEAMRMSFAGAGYRAPAPGDYTRIIRDGVLWMSDTPAEIRDHLDAIREIRRRGGRVLINGLGIGLIVKAALACENVTHIDVVEIDPDVAEHVGGHYAQDPRVTIHVADAHTIQWPTGTRWAVAWHDIWANITLDDLESRTLLNRRYGRRTDWQAGWAEYEIKVAQRRDARGWW